MAKQLDNINDIIGKQVELRTDAHAVLSQLGKPFSMQESLDFAQQLPEKLKEVRLGTSVLDHKQVSAKLDQDLEDLDSKIGFSLVPNPANGDSVALYVNSGIGQSSFIPIKNPANLPYIHAYLRQARLNGIHAHSMGRLIGEPNQDQFMENCCWAMIRDVLSVSHLPQEMFSTEEGLKCLKQLLPLHIQTYCNANVVKMAHILSEKDDLSMEDKQKFMAYFTTKITSKLKEITPEVIENLIKNMQAVDLAHGSNPTLTDDSSVEL